MGSPSGEGFVGSVSHGHCVGSSGKALFWGVRRSYRLREVLNALRRMGGNSEKVLGGSPLFVSESLCAVSEIAPGLGMFWSLHGGNGYVLSRSPQYVAGRIAERGLFLEGCFREE